MSQIPVLKPFQEIEETEWVDYDDLPQYENFGGLSIPYKKEYLKAEVETELFFPADEQNIQIKSNVELSDNPDRTTIIIIYMAYDSRNKKLTLEPIHISDWDETTRPHSTGGHYYDGEIIYQYLENYNITEEDIREYQNYILYEVVLKTWIETHGGDYEWEKKKLENCEIVDHTFDFPKE